MTPPRNTKGQFTKRAQQLDESLQSEGARIAREIRQKANSLTSEERAELDKEAQKLFSLRNPNNRIAKKPADDFDEESEALAEALCNPKEGEWLRIRTSTFWLLFVSAILTGSVCMAILFAVILYEPESITFDVLTTPVYPATPDPIINPQLELDRPNSPPQVFMMIETTQTVPSEYRVTGWRNGEPILLEKR